VPSNFSTPSESSISYSCRIRLGYPYTVCTVAG